MPIKDGREYRYIAPFSAVESEGDEPSYIVEGYATTFDVPYDFGLDGMKEMISSSAFKNTDISDVIFQYDHEGLVMARQRNGSLEVTLDPHGMKIRADLSGSQKGRELYEAIHNGLVDRMSWAFTVPMDGWEYDADTRTSTVIKVGKVYDVSAVSIPANEGTYISARSYFDGVIEAEKQELLHEQELSQRTEQEKRDRAKALLLLTSK